MPALITYVAIAAVVSIAIALYLHFSGVHSGALSRSDHLFVGAAMLGAAIIVMGPLVSRLHVASLSTLLGIIAVIVAASLGGAELIWHSVKHQRAPASLVYHALAKPPYLIRYWPTWALAESEAVINETTTIQFRLIPSEFDFNLVLINPSGTLQPGSNSQPRAGDLPEQDKERLISSLHLAVPVNKSECAITETGIFRTDKNIEFVCDAPTFEPARTSIKTSIDALVENTLSIPLVPKSPGARQIVFHLSGADGIAAGSLRIECKVVSAKRPIRRLILRVTLGLTTILGLAASASTIIEKVKALLMK